MKSPQEWWKRLGGRHWLEDRRTTPAVVREEDIAAIQADARKELEAEVERLREEVERLEAALRDRGFE